MQTQTGQSSTQPLSPSGLACPKKHKVRCEVKSLTTPNQASLSCPLPFSNNVYPRHPKKVKIDSLVETNIIPKDIGRLSTFFGEVLAEVVIDQSDLVDDVVRGANLGEPADNIYRDISNIKIYVRKNIG